jgi:hypothetical protein
LAGQKIWWVPIISDDRHPPKEMIGVGRQPEGWLYPSPEKIGLK